MPVGIRFFITIKRKNQILQTQKFYSHNIFRFDIPRIAWYNISIVREGTSMKKYYELDEELRKVLDEVRVQMQTTVISYPERNPHDRVWGANNYPGNCSGNSTFIHLISNQIKSLPVSFYVTEKIHMSIIFFSL